MKKRYFLSLLAFFTILNATVYEDGTDVSNWGLLDALPATVTSVYDNNISSDVLQLSGPGYRGAYIYGYGDNEWKNSTEKYLKVSLKYSEYFSMYIRVMTQKGFRFLQYSPDGNEGKAEVYIKHSLEDSITDGSWHTLNIDLEKDLQKYEPDNSIVEVNGIIFRGSGYIDDIELYNPINQIPTVDAGEDKIVKEGESVDINATVLDSDGAIISYEWKEGDTVLATTKNFQYLASELGVHNLTITVTDDDGAINEDNLTVVVTPSNTYQLILDANNPQLNQLLFSTISELDEYEDVTVIILSGDGTLSESTSNEIEQIKSTLAQMGIALNVTVLPYSSYSVYSFY